MDVIQENLYLVSAPSGAGKSTIIHRVIDHVPNLVLSVSHTSRNPRPSEKDGVDYYFISSVDFKKKIEKSEFLEWAEVHGNFYGTSIKEINALLQQKKNVILDIDVQGALQIRQNKHFNPVYIFIVPPSLQELERRLKNRGTENSETMKKRLMNAEKELPYKDQYDHVIVNDVLDDAVNEFKRIIEKNSKRN